MFRRNNSIWHKGLAFMSSSIASYQTRWYNKIILRKGYSFSRDFSWIENYKLKSFCQWKFLLTKFLSVRYLSTLGLFVSFFCLFVLFTFWKKFITLLDKIFPDDEVFLYSDICVQLIFSLSVGSGTLDTYSKLRGRIYKICRAISNPLAAHFQ